MATHATLEKEQEVKPLAYPSPAVAPISGESGDEETITRWKSVQYLRRRRTIFWCCGCCGATVVVLGVVILILAFTVFKVKDPEITLNHVYFTDVDAGFRSLEDPFSVNATLTADVSIKNPNVASFKFDNSTTEFYYRGETLGVAYAPDGKVSARRTVTMNVTVDVLADKVNDSNATRTILNEGMLNLTSYTDLTGRVNVMGIYKRDIDVLLNCTMTLDLSLTSQELQNKVCVANVR